VTITSIRSDARVAYTVYPGTALDGPVWRVTEQCPPVAGDFISYGLAGRGFSDRMFFRATGVSMFVTRREAVKLARWGRFGNCVAELDIADERIYFALTNERTGHIDVWARPRVLLNSVVNCDDRGRGKT
jgi:hypothetical protein